MNDKRNVAFRLEQRLLQYNEDNNNRNVWLIEIVVLVVTNRGCKCSQNKAFYCKNKNKKTSGFERPLYHVSQIIRMYFCLFMSWCVNNTSQLCLLRISGWPGLWISWENLVFFNTEQYLCSFMSVMFEHALKCSSELCSWDFTRHFSEYI